jgi:hypothetical protein
MPSDTPPFPGLSGPPSQGGGAGSSAQGGIPGGAPTHVEPDALDPELLALPDPPKGERTLTVLLLALTAFSACAMSFALRGDAAYAFGPAEALDLGELREVSPAAALPGNRYVRAQGVLGAAGAIRFERPFESDSYRLSPVAGRRDLWVEVRVPSGEETPRYVPPTSFAGRLVAFDQAGPRQRGLVSAIETATGEAVPRGAKLLVDEELPSKSRWAVALAAVFFAFAVWNAAAIARLVGRAR